MLKAFGYGGLVGIMIPLFSLSSFCDAFLCFDQGLINNNMCSTHAKIKFLEIYKTRRILGLLDVFCYVLSRVYTPNRESNRKKPSLHLHS